MRKFRLVKLLIMRSHINRGPETIHLYILFYGSMYAPSKIALAYISNYSLSCISFIFCMLFSMNSISEKFESPVDVALQSPFLKAEVV